MTLPRYSLLLVAVVFVLLLVGGTVNPTGSSLACPDWPLCYGQVFPKMEGGILYEHSHRLVATLVGLMTIGLAAWITRARKEDKRLVKLGWTALGLVILQGVLGGITVLLKLPLMVSAGHLALSMFFFCFVVYIAFELNSTPEPNAAPIDRSAAAITALAVYFQIFLGALVRHTGSGRACGQDWMTCGGVLWPEWGPGKLQMLHRFVGYAVFVLIMFTAVRLIKTAKASNRRFAKILAMTMHPLIALQIILGWVTVATGIGVHPVVTHLGVGALILVGNWAIYLALGPRKLGV